jgi:protein-serine/threonine kinase
MVETEKHIGIILEYASGGELFDYILNHRYLKDNAARKLFAQLISGVGYLHKKGIVHRDLKLENLLLDRNRNIIITDFGFANTFNPDDELGEEIEYGLASREFVKRMELDKVLPDGFRRGDLMQTSCGSPCYAAPELVVSDSLYTGRKVDVWSCGVILVRSAIKPVLNAINADNLKFSMLCLRAICLSMTILRILKGITLIFSTSILCLHP